MNPFIELLELKKEIIEELRGELSEESVAKAIRDPHAFRKPRQCGITIHTGIGCSYMCAYCYIYDMGFPAMPKPYPLSPVELAYSLALNPYVIPNKTLAAYGSVTEPFLKETVDRAIEYIVSVYKYLKLPSQVSTKSSLSNELLKALAHGDKCLSILITLITLEKHGVIEREAPSPMDRLEGASRALKSGFKVALFIRPVIPELTDREFEKILNLAELYGVREVVLGSLRVTHTNVLRMKAAGLDVSSIELRLSRKPKVGEQLAIYSADLKSKLMKLAVERGFKVFESACAANISAHNDYCAMCSKGPCGSFEKAPKVSSDEVIELLLTEGLRVSRVSVSRTRIAVELDKGSRRKSIGVLKAIMSQISRRTVEFSEAP
ncbi:MAG: radical SAM protein [Desulfurococcaceae archaeon]